MTQNHLAQYNVEELQGYFSDFHKDFYGFRPRTLGSSEDWNNREWLEAQITRIHDTMDAMKETFVGREELRRQGWVVDEAEFDNTVDPKEYAEWSADGDVQAYGEMV
jgi:hypothetical protein